jgi:hypothetical protein|tara:strand:- start:970 stop:1269 length:300 start_codon:yes stop_codon:yes gene_type:complete
MEATKEKRAGFTQGPWIVEAGKEYSIRSRNSVVMLIGDARRLIPMNEDARLIAAAPEMFEQCKLFEKCLTHLINSGDSGADLERDKLREVLAKVDGGEG